MNSVYVWVHAYVHALYALVHGKWVHEDRRSVYVYTEVKPDRVTCHFCVFAVCGNVPMEKALVVLMLPFTPVFSPLLWHETEENPLSPSVCVCVYALAPRHLRCCRGKSLWPGEPQTGRHTERLRSNARHTCLCTLTHAFAHKGYTFNSVDVHEHRHISMTLASPPSHTLS